MTETGSATKAFKPWYRVYQHEDQVIFHYGDSVICLKGRAAGEILQRLLPVLDGRHSIDDIASISREDAKVVNAAINLLERYDLLMDGSAPSENDELARTSVFLSAIGGVSSTQSIHERLAAARVEVIGSGNAASEILRGLHGSGIAGAYSGSISSFAEGPADLAIVAPSTAEVTLLRDINKVAIQKRRPWLQVLPYDGRFVAIGPLFVPGETACYACFQLRRASNVKYSKEFLQIDGAKAAFEQCMPLDMTAAGLAVTYALRWLGAHDPALVGRLLAFQPLSDRGLSTHEVLRVPRCSECAGVVNVTAPSPWFES